ncbi:MAG TPA: hypothetical protein VLE97_10610 [Gaiellaceae bacterium]|nr:hypothetical protein [Gaiellaceae bacterium]
MRKKAGACPREKRDGRSSPGAWRCPICKHWHYLKRNPVRRGTVPSKRNGDPVDWSKLW